MGCGKSKKGPQRLADLSNLLHPNKAFAPKPQARWPDRVADVKKSVQARSGRSSFCSRYHQLPKQLADDYVPDSQHILGIGYNGSVYLAVSRHNGAKFAVKSFELENANLQLVQAEAEIFLSLDHPHVARLVDVYESATHLHMVMECMEGGEVLKRLLARKRYSEQDAAHAVWQMLLAVNYLHGRGIVHKDLKLQNFLYQDHNADHLKLIDFGFSQIWDQSTHMSRSCGTLAYAAPEVINGGYTSQCDLWSLGVVCFVLLVGHMPFVGEEKAMKESILAGTYRWKHASWSHISDVGVDFVRMLLEMDPRRRLTAQQALQHPWVVNREGLPSSAEVDLASLGALCNFKKAPQFRRACMLMMAWSLSFDERSKVKKTFQAVDESRQGTITLRELQKALSSKFQVGDEHVKPIFDALDVSQNNEILYTEFLAAMVDTQIEMHEGLVQSAFKKFDVDRSGYITTENLREVFGDSFNGMQVDHLIQQGDLTKDGQISYEEFIEYLKGDEISRCTTLDCIATRTNHSRAASKEASSKPVAKIIAL